MGAIIAVVLILGCFAAISTTAAILYVRHKRLNRPVPIDPQTVVKQIERSQQAEWDEEFRRLWHQHSRNIPPTERELSLIKGWDPYDDGGEEIVVRSFNGQVVLREWIPSALAVSMTSRDIEAWQRKTHASGLYSGPIDGEMGEMTWRAIREFDRRRRGIS